MAQRFKAFWIGIIVIVAAILTIWLVLFLRPHMGDGRKILKIRFTNIEKINIGTRITFGGKAVGEVTKINEIFNARELPTDANGNIYFYELVVRIDSHVHIYSYDQIIFSTAGILGEKTIAILPKQAPAGSPPAYELKDVEVLYARSSDKLDETIDKMICVADVFEQTMSEVLCFFKENSEGIHTALTTINGTAREVDKFFASANEKNLVPLLSQTITNFNAITGQISSGQGAMGQLLYSNQLYYQIEMTMTRLEEVMSDLHNYGLFYQFDRGWQRQKKMRAMQMQHFSQADKVNAYFNDEIQRVSTSLKRVGRVVSNKEMKKKFAFDPRFEAVVKQIEEMEKNLQETTQMFTRMNKELVSK